MRNNRRSRQRASEGRVCSRHWPRKRNANATLAPGRRRCNDHCYRCSATRNSSPPWPQCASPLLGRVSVSRCAVNGRHRSADSSRHGHCAPVENLTRSGCIAELHLLACGLEVAGLTPDFSIGGSLCMVPSGCELWTLRAHRSTSRGLDSTYFER